MKDPSNPMNPASLYAYGWFRRKRERRCPKCGVRIADSYKYCPECGTKLKAENVLEASDKDMAILGILSFIIGFPICITFYSLFISISIQEAFIISLFTAIPVGFVLLLLFTLIYAIFFSKKKKHKHMGARHAMT